MLLPRAPSLIHPGYWACPYLYRQLHSLPSGRTRVLHPRPVQRRARVRVPHKRSLASFLRYGMLRKQSTSYAEPEEMWIAIERGAVLRWRFDPAIVAAL